MQRLKAIRFCALAAVGLVAFNCSAVVVNGVEYECTPDGVCRPVFTEENNKAKTETAPESTGSIEAGFEAPNRSARISVGYLNAEDLAAFIRNELKQPAVNTQNLNIALTILLVLLGGLAMNLTPCVLPVIPVSLAVIGAGVARKSAKDGALRGLVYGSGMVAAFGSLGLAASFGALAFGTLQSSPWFNAAMAMLFVALALAMFGLFNIDFSHRRKTAGHAAGLAGVFAMGAVSALLSGACVAPALVAVLALTAKLSASGSWWAAALPFVFGLGMASPWPLAGAGIGILPKPGSWMLWIKRIFGLFMLALAFYYAIQACYGFGFINPDRSHDSAINATSETFETALATELASNKTVVVDIWAVWCKNCSEMDKSFSSPEVKKAMGGYSFIKLQIQNPDELKKLPSLAGYAIGGLPAVAVFDQTR